MVEITLPFCPQHHELWVLPSTLCLEGLRDECWFSLKPHFLSAEGGFEHTTPFVPN